MQEETVVSPVTDLSDVPLSEKLAVDSAEYIRIMRRIGLIDSGTSSVCASFNSSI